MDNGFDANEKFETPLNMCGKPFPIRLFYAHFSRPGNAPYVESDAVLTFPFNPNIEYWNAYRFHETRLAGFGPFFSGTIVLSVLIFIMMIVKKQSFILFCLLFYAAIIVSISLSNHLWWPRLAPQIWLIPIVPLLISLKYRNITFFQKAFNNVLIYFIAINSIIVLCVHLTWETQASSTIKSQLRILRENKKPIKVDVGWFERSTEENLKKYNISYRVVHPDSISKKQQHELLNVVPGYPGAIRYVEDHN